MLKSAPTASYADLPPESPVRTLVSGELLFHEGDAAHYAFLICSGTVETYLDGGMEAEVLNIVQAGDIVGKPCAMKGMPRQASARAVGPASVLVLPKDVFDDDAPLSRDIVDALREYASRHGRVASVD